MQKGRFIEIPALHQTAIFKKDVLLEVVTAQPLCRCACERESYTSASAGYARGVPRRPDAGLRAGCSGGHELLARFLPPRQEVRQGPPPPARRRLACVRAERSRAVTLSEGGRSGRCCLGGGSIRGSTRARTAASPSRTCGRSRCGGGRGGNSELCRCRRAERHRRRAGHYHGPTVRRGDAQAPAPRRPCRGFIALLLMVCPDSAPWCALSLLYRRQGRAPLAGAGPHTTSSC